jgi:putative hydrolase of the HAD superfamily
VKSAIYFDLDNTLTDRNASIDVFAKRFIAHFSKALFVTSVYNVSNIIREQDNGGYLDKSSPYQKISQAVSRELHNQLAWKTEVSIEFIEQFWKAEFPHSTVEMKGANQLINALHLQGFHLGVISNGAEASRQKTVASTIFGHLFMQVVSSGEFGVKKPNCSIFIETAKVAGFTPSQCVYIGDHPINDIYGAINAGMTGIWLQGFHDPSGLPNDAIKITNLDEIRALLLTC